MKIICPIHAKKYHYPISIINQWEQKSFFYWIYLFFGEVGTEDSANGKILGTIKKKKKKYWFLILEYLIKESVCLSRFLNIIYFQASMYTKIFMYTKSFMHTKFIIQMQFLLETVIIQVDSTSSWICKFYEIACLEKCYLWLFT